MPRSPLSTAPTFRRRACSALPQAQWKLLAEPPFSYLETLDRVDAAMESNAELARLVVNCGRCRTAADVGLGLLGYLDMFRRGGTAAAAFTGGS